MRPWHWGMLIVRLLVVQDNAELGRMWCRFLARQGMRADLAVSQQTALDYLSKHHYDVLVIEPDLEGGGGLPIADFASFRNPDVSILAVTRSTFFSEAMIFDIMPNARALLRTPVPPQDLAAYIEYFDETAQHGRRSRKLAA